MAKQKRNPSEFGNRLREKRKAAGLTQKQIAEVLGITQPAIADLESNPDANPSLSTITRLAAALGCQPADLIPPADEHASK